VKVNYKEAGMVDIKKGLTRYKGIFKEADEQGKNEADTSLRIGKFFEDVLGYDIFEELSREHMIKERYVDYAVKIKGKIVFLIEVKQSGIKLKEKHIEQASNYAANGGYPWILLTNGRYWQMYHLSFDEGIQNDLIWSVDLLEEDIKAAACKIGQLHRKSILKKEHERYYARIKTLAPAKVLQAIFHENTLSMIRRHLKKMTGISVDEQDLCESIKKMISPESWQEIGEVKVKRQKKKPRVQKEAPSIQEGKTEIKLQEGEQS